MFFVCRSLEIDLKGRTNEQQSWGVEREEDLQWVEGTGHLPFGTNHGLR